MPPSNLSETTQPLDFEEEYDEEYDNASNPDPLFLPDEEMDDDEGDDDVDNLLMALDPQDGNQETNSHSDELQPNPGERLMLVRLYNTLISYLLMEFSESASAFVGTN
jgi:hypothetical protein